MSAVRLAALLPLLLLLPTSGSVAHEEKKKDSCTECHSDPDFLVTNKKLYDYFEQWQSSIHQQEGVACDDCHGGDPEASDKDRAHGEGVSASDRSSGIHFKNVGATCGECHEAILEGFLNSHHAGHLEIAEQEQQGPTCVTCHGSIDVHVLSVNSVEKACARCHNEENDNHPETPEKARAILSRFLSIQRFYRFIAIRAGAEEAKAFFTQLDPRLRQLSLTWHTFDLEKIGEETADILTRMKVKRDELRQRSARAM